MCLQRKILHATTKIHSSQMSKQIKWKNTHTASWKAFFLTQCWMEYSFFLSPAGLQIMIQKVSLKKKKKEHDYKHVHVETQVSGMCRESWVFYTKVWMLKTIKSFLSKQYRRQDSGTPFKAININAPCHCVLVWPETALDQSVLRVIFPHFQCTPSLLMYFSALPLHL